MKPSKKWAQIYFDSFSAASLGYGKWMDPQGQGKAESELKQSGW